MTQKKGKTNFKFSRLGKSSALENAGTRIGEKSIRKKSYFNKFPQKLAKY